MFNIKTIEDNFDNYNNEQLKRKIEVVGLKSQDIEEEIELLMKQMHDLEMRNIVLEFNMHGIVKDRVDDTEKVVFDSSFVKLDRRMEKEVQNHANTYKLLLKEGQLIRKNYQIIEKHNNFTKQRVTKTEQNINNHIHSSQQTIFKLQSQQNQNKIIQQSLIQQKTKLQSQLESLVTFYQNIGSDIQSLQSIKDQKYKVNQSTVQQITFLKQDSQIRHFNYNQKLANSQKAIKRMQKDLITVENKIHEHVIDNRRLSLIKVEIDKNNKH